MAKRFIRYSSIGVLNTLIHWLVFAFVYAIIPEQSISNLVGFLSSVSFSFYMNAKWTFNSSMTVARYIAMVLFMALLSWLFGQKGDELNFPPYVVLVSFSLASLVLGFLFTRYVVFRDS